MAVTSSKQWIHFLRSDRWPPTSNSLRARRGSWGGGRWGPGRGGRLVELQVEGGGAGHLPEPPREPPPGAEAAPLPSVPWQGSASTQPVRHLPAHLQGLPGVLLVWPLSHASARPSCQEHTCSWLLGVSASVCAPGKVPMSLEGGRQGLSPARWRTSEAPGGRVPTVLARAGVDGWV